MTSHDFSIPTNKKQLHIDSEFRSLIPPLSDEERELLVTSIKTEGCRDALVVWQDYNILIDGHNRYDICRANDLPYRIIEKPFDSREDVIVWIIRNQFGRRNISSFVRSELALKLKDAIAGRAKANQGKRTDILSNLTKSLEPVDTRKELANTAGVSAGTMHKVEVVTTKAPESIKAAARRGDISTHQAYEVTRALEDAPETIKNKVSELAQAGATPTAVQVKSFIKDHKRSEKAIAKAAIPGNLPSDDRLYRLYTGDICDIMPTLEAGSIDAIITDPPYPREFLPVYLQLAKHAPRLLKPGGSLLVMIGQSYLPEVLALMTPYIQYNWMLTYLTPGGQSAQLWDRHVNTFWKPILWFTNGKYEGDWIGDVLKSSGNDKNYHHWGQSESGMADIIERFTYPGQTILDPFVGGGTTGSVAITMKRQFVGIDIDAKAIETTRIRISDALLEGAA